MESSAIRKTWCPDWAYRKCDQLIMLAWDELSDQTGADMLEKLEQLEDDTVKRRFQLQTALEIAGTIASEAQTEATLNKADELTEDLENIQRTWKSTRLKRSPKTTADTSILSTS